MKSRVVPGLPVETVIDLHRIEIDLANAVIAATPPDDPPAWWPGDLFGDCRLKTVREIAFHVMTETATHAGHLDATRELVGGHSWLLLTG